MQGKPVDDLDRAIDEAYRPFFNGPVYTLPVGCFKRASAAPPSVIAMFYVTGYPATNSRPIPNPVKNEKIDPAHKNSV